MYIYISIYAALGMRHAVTTGPRAVLTCTELSALGAGNLDDDDGLGIS